VDMVKRSYGEKEYENIWLTKIEIKYSAIACLYCF
jgi:hypothetical protein